MKISKIALTGKLRVGKDTIAEKCGGTIVSMAHPLYVVGEYLTGIGPEHKDKVPFLREFYQRFGQWGRGEFSAEYPLTMERLLMTAWVKSGQPAKLLPWVKWEEWGTENIWINSMFEQVEQISQQVNRVFVSNCRFHNEYKALAEAGWDIWHVLCSRQTYEERLRDVDLSVNSPKLRDTSEKLALELDRRTVEAIQTQPVGPKLKVIWNDSRPSPCERLQTLEQFQAYLENQETEPEYTNYEQTETTPTPTSDPGDGSSNVEEPRAHVGTEVKQNRDPAARRRDRKSAKRS
jgi:hypothetical protein